MSLNLDVSRYDNLEDLIESCIAFIEKNNESINNEYVRDRRKKLASFIEKFHTESGTLTPKVKEKCKILRKELPVILMTAHQPNLFPYSGVMRKATLVSTIGRELERRLGTPVVSFFGIADQDFSDDRWVKSSLLPAINRRDGALVVSIDLPEKVMLNTVPKPSIKKINKWRDEIENWLRNILNPINKFCKENKISNWDSKESLIYHNFEMYWEIVKEAHARAVSYSDFNAYIMSKIINDAWGHDILFSRFSDCQQIFINEFNTLLKNFKEYSSSLEKISSFLYEKEGRKGVSKIETQLLPFWYHCDCGSKARLSLYELNDSRKGHGFCIKCNKEFNLNIGKADNIDVTAHASNISARAIPMILVFSNGLGLTCYVGGIGGVEYLREAKYLAKKINMTIPPIAFWRPRDIYLGISQLETLLEYKRITGNYEIHKYDEEIERLKNNILNINEKIYSMEMNKERLINKLKNKSIDMKKFKMDLKKILNEIADIKKRSNLSVLTHDLKMLKNIPIVLDFIPSIIDYAINIGLNETNMQWTNFLLNNESFSSDVYLTSLLDDLTKFEKTYLKI